MAKSTIRSLTAALRLDTGDMPADAAKAQKLLLGVGADMKNSLQGGEGGGGTKFTELTSKIGLASNAMRAGVDLMSAGMALARGDMKGFEEGLASLPFGMGAAYQAGKLLAEVFDDESESLDRLNKRMGEQRKMLDQFDKSENMLKGFKQATAVANAEGVKGDEDLAAKRRDDAQKDIRKLEIEMQAAGNSRPEQMKLLRQGADETYQAEINKIQKTEYMRKLAEVQAQSEINRQKEEEAIKTAEKIAAAELEIARKEIAAEEQAQADAAQAGREARSEMERKAGQLPQTGQISDPTATWATIQSQVNQVDIATKTYDELKAMVALWTGIARNGLPITAKGGA